MTQLTILLGPHEDADPLISTCQEVGSRHKGYFSLRQWGQTVEFAHESAEAVDEARRSYEGQAMEQKSKARVVHF